MERTARIQTIEELREACAEFGVEMSPEDEQAFMAAKAELRRGNWTPRSADRVFSAPDRRI